MSLTSFLPRRAELREMMQLALPVVVVQVGLMSMGVVDVIMVGHVSAEALAAVALGNLYFFCSAVFGMGSLLALDPVISQAVGAGDEPAVARGVQRGLVIAALISAGTSLLLAPAPWVMRLLGQPAEIIPAAAAYARIAIPGTLPFFAFIVLRQSLQAMGKLLPIVVAIVIANLANVALNWVFIFGHLGSPPMGAAGSSIATSISRWLLAGSLLVLAWSWLRPHLRALQPEVKQLTPLLRMLRLGVPIGFQFQVEYGTFAVIALMMGWIGATAMAGHQVAINLASLTYMVPLGISAAAAVLVGRAVGRGDAPSARRFARATMLCGGTFMAASALVLLAAPTALARVYATDAAVVAVAASLIPLAGLFQVFDGLQVVATGVLRGVGDTRAPLAINVFGFLLVGMPISVYLGLHAGGGPRGLWWGIVVGLAAVALVLALRVRRRLRGELSRLVMDDALPSPPAAALARPLEVLEGEL